MNDTIKISIQSTRLTLTADHPADDRDGIRQTLALIQTFLATMLGDADAASPVRATRRGRSRIPDSAKAAGGAQ